MRIHRMTAAVAAVLLVGSMGGCAELTTTGVPEGEEAGNEMVKAEEGNPLVGTTWVLTDSTLTDVDLQDAQITADFFKEQMSGQAPVNSYFAGYHVEDQRIEIEAVGATRMAGPPALMAAESAYFTMLGRVSTFEFSDDSLILQADGTDVLEYVPAGQEGSATDVQAGGAQDINTVAESLIGMSAADAEAAATDAGFAFRVTSTDGKPAAVTMDYREDRINAEIEDDEVVRVTVG